MLRDEVIGTWEVVSYTAQVYGGGAIGYFDYPVLETRAKRRDASARQNVGRHTSARQPNKHHVNSTGVFIMKIVLLAATGQAGRTILSELISRGHEVTAVARNPDKLPKSINRVGDDLSNADRIAEIIAGADAVVSAFDPLKDNPRFFSDVNYTDQLASVTERMIAAVRKAGVPRLILLDHKK
jgi:hypothetical protein